MGTVADGAVEELADFVLDLPLLRPGAARSALLLHLATFEEQVPNGQHDNHQGSDENRDDICPVGREDGSETVHAADPLRGLDGPVRAIEVRISVSAWMLRSR